MANVKISGFPVPFALPVGAPNGSEVYPADQVSGSIRQTVSITVAALFGAATIAYPANGGLSITEAGGSTSPAISITATGSAISTAPLKLVGTANGPFILNASDGTNTGAFLGFGIAANGNHLQFGTTGNFAMEFLTNNSIRAVLAANGQATLNVPGAGTTLRVNGVTGNSTFTGTSPFTATIGFAGADSTDYTGIDFSDTATPKVRIGAIFGGGGSSLSIGTSNNYSLGITNTALTVNPSGTVSFAGAIGVNGNAPPAQLTGWGTPVGGAVVASYNITDAGGANSNTNKAVAEIIVALKSLGFFGA